MGLASFTEGLRLLSRVFRWGHSRPSRGLRLLHFLLVLDKMDDRKTCCRCSDRGLRQPQCCAPTVLSNTIPAYGALVGDGVDPAAGVVPAGRVAVAPAPGVPVADAPAEAGGSFSTWPIWSTEFAVMLLRLCTWVIQAWRWSAGMFCLTAM